MFATNPYYSNLANFEGGSAFALGALAVLVVVLGHQQWRGRRRYVYRPKWKAFPQPAMPRPPAPKIEIVDYRDHADNLADPTNQMRAVAKAEFETVPLLNKEEARLLPFLERTTRKCGDGHRLMAQTSLGEVLRPRKGTLSDDDHRRAMASINSKRIDFAIVDRFGHLKIAIEYQGSGHYQQTTTYMRDSVKHEALRKAGVDVYPVRSDYDQRELEAQICRLLQKGRSKNEPPTQ